MWHVYSIKGFKGIGYHHALLTSHTTNFDHDVAQENGDGDKGGGSTQAQPGPVQASVGRGQSLIIRNHDEPSSPLEQVRCFLGQLPHTHCLGTSLRYQNTQSFTPYTTVDDLLKTQDLKLPLLLQIYIAAAKNPPIQQKMREGITCMPSGSTDLDPVWVLNWLVCSLNHAPPSTSAVAHHTGPRPSFGTKAKGASLGLVEFGGTYKAPPFSVLPGTNGRGLVATNNAPTLVAFAIQMTRNGLLEHPSGAKTGQWYVKNYHHIAKVHEAMRNKFATSEGRSALRHKNCSYVDGRIARAVLAPYGPFEWSGVLLRELKYVSPDVKDNCDGNAHWGGLMDGTDVCEIQAGIAWWVDEDNSKDCDEKLSLLRPELLTMWRCLLREHLLTEQ